MVKAPMDVYMQTLAGYIHDEDKLVTYKWLSKELEVHVNTAKEILAEYWEKHKNDGIVSTIMLIGNTKDGGMRVEVVKESELEEATKKYEKILSQHLYSLQKNLSDIEALANVGKGDSKFSAIKCKESVLLSDEELFARRWGAGVKFQAQFDEKSYVPPPIKTHEKVNPLKKAFSNAKPGESKEKEKEKSKENEADAKSEGKKTSPSSKDEAKKKSPSNLVYSSYKMPKDHKKTAKKPVQSTKTGFSALFGKVQNQKKSPPSNENVQNQKKSSETDENVQNQKKSVATDENVRKESAEAALGSSKDDEMEVDFDIDEEELLKHEGKAEKKIAEEKASDKDDEERSEEAAKRKSPGEGEKKSSALKEKNTPEEEKKTTTSGKSGKKNDAEEQKKTIISGKSGKKSANRGKKRGRSQEASDESKKRKRIVVVSDSSESEEEREEEPDPFGTSITEEPVEKKRSLSPPTVQQINGKRKVRKMVDKTFVDEDGFMVTKKVQVLVSASEDDEPVEITKEKKKSPVKNSEASKAKKANKQASIMNFFKKV